MANVLTPPVEITAPPTEVEQNDHRFFDPKNPDMPEQVLGLETDKLLRLGNIAMETQVLPYTVWRGLYVMPHALRLLPLIEQMQAGGPIEPEDIRPYRKPIKNLHGGLYAADKFAAAAIVTGLPLRRALNQKIERQFPERAGEYIAKAREAVASVEGEVDFVASFENPREQFTSEVGELAQRVSGAITEQHDERVRSGTTTEPEPPGGVLGFFTRAVRKVRNFFRFGRKPEVNQEVTAHDAGIGIGQVLGDIRNNPTEFATRMPMLSKFVFENAMAKASGLTKDMLALGAPEILQFIFSLSPDNSNAQELMESVKRNPHELRFVAEHKKRIRGFWLPSIRHASWNLLPAIQDILPTEGGKVREIYDRLQDLLRYEPPVVAPEPAATPETDVPKKGLRNRLKSFFRRRKSR